MKRQILSSILLLLALCCSSFNFTQPVHASGEPYFSIVDAQRTYEHSNTNVTIYGYFWSIIIKNVGDYAESVTISWFFDFMENGTKLVAASFEYSWNTSEVRSIDFGMGWENQIAVPRNRWIKLVTSAQTQTFLIYFDTVLDVSANPSELEYPQDVTISGRLMNITSGVGMPNEDVSLYIDGVHTTDIQTDSDGNYTHVWRPTYGTHHVYVIWSHGEGAVNWTYVTVRTPTNLSISLSSSTTYIGFKVEISGRLTCTNGTSVPASPIRLAYSVTGGESWNHITSANTGTDGTYSALWIPPATGVYMVRASWTGKQDESIWILGANATVSLAVTPFAEQYVFSALSNSTVSDLTFDSEARELTFTVSGTSGTSGFVKVFIAKQLVADVENLEVKLNDEEVDYSVTALDDSWLLHFTYHHSRYDVIVSLGPQDALAPTLTNLEMQPEKPKPDNEITITISVTEDQSGIKEVTLYYSTDAGSSWNTVPMSRSEGSTYKATIPRQNAGTILHYYVEAFDNSLNKATSSTNSFTVEAPAAPLIGAEMAIAIIIIVILGAIIGSVYFLRSRKRKSKSTGSHMHAGLSSFLGNCSGQENRTGRGFTSH